MTGLDLTFDTSWLSNIDKLFIAFRQVEYRHSISTRALRRQPSQGEGSCARRRGLSSPSAFLRPKLAYTRRSHVATEAFALIEYKGAQIREAKEHDLSLVRQRRG